MTTTVLVAVVGTIAVVAIAVGLILAGMRAGKNSTEKIWDNGKRQAGQEFTSMWDTQKLKFKDAVRSLELEMNNQMLEAVRNTKTAGDPILRHLQTILSENQTTPPAGGPSDSQPGEPDNNALRPPITRVK